MGGACSSHTHIILLYIEGNFQIVRNKTGIELFDTGPLFCMWVWFNKCQTMKIKI